MKGVRLNPFQHALKRPDAYVGNAKTREYDVYVYENGKAVPKKFLFNRALFNIIREILSNAIDNVWNSKKLDPSNPVRCITLSIERATGKISIKNDGYCIPVELKEYEYEDHRTGKVLTEKKYPQEVFFGDMFAGTNLDDTEERKTSGRNGMGGKATNVFSTEFTVESSNPIQGKAFKQTYKNNGKERSIPTITNHTAKGYTTITFTPDYKYFSYPNEEVPGMDENLVAVLKLYAHEVSMISGVKTKFIEDGVETAIQIPTLEKYVKMFTERKTASFKLPNGDECVLVEKDDGGMEEAQDISHHSFVNGIRTTEGGIHLDAWRDALIPTLVKTYNKGKKDHLKASAKLMYPYLTLFIRIEADRPKFDSQTKDRLTEIFNSENKSVPYSLFSSPKEKKEWSTNLKVALEKVMGWQFIKELDSKILSKYEGKAPKVEKSDKELMLSIEFHDAKLAGVKPELCALHAGEGKSALAMILNGIGCIKGGMDTNGAVALRGKFINALKNKDEKVERNKESKLLQKLLGIHPKIDYSIDENFKKVRYHTLTATVDADEDGTAILCLLAGYFYTKFYTLFCRPGFFDHLSTAVLTVSFKTQAKDAKSLTTMANGTLIPRTADGNSKILFYSLSDAEAWFLTQEAKEKGKLETKYCKGLGSVTPDDIPSYFLKKKILSFELDEGTGAAIQKGIGGGKENTKQRKDWINESLKELAKFKDIKHHAIQYEGKISLTNYFEQRLLTFHQANVRRSIPCLWDGLKEGQRKILFTVLKQNYPKPTRVPVVCGHVMTDTGYHHGESSLQKTIIKMGHRFTGSLNCPLLVGDGQFGDLRDGGQPGGSAAAIRYLHTKAEDICRAIFPVEDDCILSVRREDNDDVEFDHFIGVIPLVLANGGKGIGSGSSTNTPNYNPLTIVEWIRVWLDDPAKVKDLPPLVPWYQGFKGQIELTKTKAGKVNGWRSTGLLRKCTTKEHNGWWEITELPIGVWKDTFVEHLNKLNAGDSKGKQKGVVKDIAIYGAANTVDYKIKFSKNFTPDINTAGNMSILRKKQPLTNIVLLDENSIPTTYENPEAVLEAYCPRRLEYYGKRKVEYLKVLKRDMLRAKNKYIFVKAVATKELDINQKKGVLYEAMEKMELEKLDDSFDYLLKLDIKSLTVEKLAKIEAELENSKRKYDALEKASNKDLWCSDLDRFMKEYKVLKSKLDVWGVCTG